MKVVVHLILLRNVKQYGLLFQLQEVTIKMYIVPCIFSHLPL